MIIQPGEQTIEQRHVLAGPDGQVQVGQITGGGTTGIDHHDLHIRTRLFGGGDELMRWLLIGLSLVICLALVLWVGRGHDKGALMRISAGLVIGGALGNMADRLLYGYVLDFLNMSCCGLNNPFVFNLADVFIFVGAAGLILFEGRMKKPA